MEDRIEKTIELAAPVSRVWRALTDHKEFGVWFRVRLEAPFVSGEVSSGQVTERGYEHMRWEAIVQKMEPERLFSYTWHPYAAGPKKPPALVELTLEKTGSGTLLRVVESGFSKFRGIRRELALHTNDRGWDMQMQNLAIHVGR